MATPRQSVEQLFEAALELPPQDRPAFLDQACGEDAELRRMVEELLLEDKRAGSFLEKPLFHFEKNGADTAVTTSEIGSSGSCRGGLGTMPANRFKPGETLGGRFAIVRFIARGGMGEVYEVEDHHLQSVRIALKMILPQYSADPATQHRFEQEVLLARKVIHPNLCPIYDIFHCEEPAPPFSFLTMRLLSGETLAARLARAGALPPEEAKSVFRQMTAGLAAIHAAGVIHRDVKPNNVMLDGEGPGIGVCITDFGLARLHESETSLLTKGVVAGTFGYMAPELLLGQPPSQATDIFAFGVVLHEVFTGEKPQVAAGSLSAVINPRLKSTDVPPDFAHLVTEFLSDDPKRRCLAFEQAQQIFDSKTSHSPFVIPVPTFWTRRRFAVTAAATTCAVIGGVRWKWDEIDDLLHPLPLKRFVALLNWPPTTDTHIKPMLAGVIDAIEGELARAEAFDRNLFIISRNVNPETKTPAQLNDIRDRLGANLVLAASGEPQAKKNFHLSLRLLDPSSTRSLREKQISLPLTEQTSLPAKAVRAAAELLGVSRYQDNRRITPDTQSPEAFAAFQAAETLMKQDNDTGLDAAIDKYKQAVELDPRYVIAFSKLALAYCRFAVINHNPAALELARSNCDTALALDPNSVEAHVAMTSVLRHRGDEAGALREMEKALSLDPSNPHTLIWQAQIYARLNRWQDAEDAFRSVLKQRPNNWLAHNELGVLFNSQGKYSEALSEFRASNLVAPRNALALNNIASIDLQLGKPSEAINELNKSLALKPTALASATMAAALRSQGKVSEALPFAQKSVNLDPGDSTNWLELGDCYSLLRGRGSDAKKAYAQAAQVQEEELETDTTDGPGWILLALSKAKSGSQGDSLSMISKADSMFDGDLDSQLYKARTLEVIGRREDALSTLATCLKKGATDFQIQLMPDMGPLRNDHRYQDLLTSARSTSPRGS